MGRVSGGSRIRATLAAEPPRPAASPGGGRRSYRRQLARCSPARSRRSLALVLGSRVRSLMDREAGQPGEAEQPLEQWRRPVDDRAEADAPTPRSGHARSASQRPTRTADPGDLGARPTAGHDRQRLGLGLGERRRARLRQRQLSGGVLRKRVTTPHPPQDDPAHALASAPSRASRARSTSPQRPARLAGPRSTPGSGDRNKAPRRSDSRSGHPKYPQGRDHLSGATSTWIGPNSFFWVHVASPSLCISRSANGHCLRQPVLAGERLVERSDRARALAQRPAAAQSDVGRMWLVLELRRRPQQVANRLGEPYRLVHLGGGVQGGPPQLRSSGAERSATVAAPVREQLGEIGGGVAVAAVLEHSREQLVGRLLGPARRPPATARAAETSARGARRSGPGTRSPRRGRRARGASRCSR